MRTGWLHAADIEMSGLEDMKVFSKGSYTIRELRRRGIDRAPMPVFLIYDRKLNPDLSFSKNEARLIQKGHPWNMQRSFGAGYIYETYAAAPHLASTRIMQALMVLLGWSPLAMDIKQAYTFMLMYVRTNEFPCNSIRDCANMIRQQDHDVRSL